jgi:hypothetical protein
MLRINLLPASLGQEKKRKVHITLAILTGLVLAALPLLYTRQT